VFAKFHARGGSLPALGAAVVLAAGPLDLSALPAELPAVRDSASLGGTIYGGPAASVAPGGPPRPVAGAPPFPKAAAAEQQRIKQLLKTQWTFSQEELLRDTLTIFTNNLVAFLVVALVVVFGEIELSRYIQAQLRTAEISLFWRLGVVFAGTLLAIPLATSAFTYGVLQEMRNLRPSVVQCLATGVRSLFRVLLVSLFQGIAVLAGMLVCFVPGLFLSLMLYVAVPAAVEERLGPLGALRRSAELTRGYRLHIFYVLTKLAIAQFALSFAANLLVGLAGAEPWVRQAVAFVIAALFVGLGATATAVAYYRLRMVKEGIGADEMVSVFD
jgi:hypothetical protein